MQDASQASTSPVGKLPGLLPRTSQTALLLVSSVDVALENATEILGFGAGWNRRFFLQLDWKSEAGYFFYKKRKNDFLVYIALRRFCILAHLRSSRIRFELFIWMFLFIISGSQGSFHPKCSFGSCHWIALEEVKLKITDPSQKKNRVFVIGFVVV